MKNFLIVYELKGFKDSVIIEAHNAKEARDIFRNSYPQARILSITFIQD